MTDWVRGTGRAKFEGAEVSDALGLLWEREEVGCASPSDRTTECIREGVLGTIFGVGGCIDDR